MSAALKNYKVMRRELIAARCIPYRAQISPHVIKTQFGDYLQVIKLSGASFETSDDEQLNTWHERLNILWRNIASANVSLWTHLIRRRENLPSPGTGEGPGVRETARASGVAAEGFSQLSSIESTGNAYRASG